MTISKVLKRAVCLSAAVCCLLVTTPADAQDSEPKDDVPFLNPLSAISPSSLTGFAERPLFAPLRRKPEPIVTETEDAAPATESLNIRLLGVIVTPKGAVARIIDLDDDARYSLRTGEAFRDWTVTSIARSKITLNKEDETKDFSVFHQADADHAPEEADEPPVETSE